MAAYKQRMMFGTMASLPVMRVSVDFFQGAAEGPDMPLRRYHLG